MIPASSQATACVTISPAPWRCQPASLRYVDWAAEILPAVFSLRQLVPPRPLSALAPWPSLE
jgi:hypothetical protein